MPRKSQTPEQKAAHAARERERYKLAREAGLSPDQARSIKKSLQNQPEIIQKASDLGISLLNSMGKLGDFFTGTTTNERRTSAATPKAPKPAAKPPDSTYKRKAVKPKQQRRTSDKLQQEAKKRDRAFKKLAKDNPDLSGRAIERLFRERNPGKGISHKKAQELIRKQKKQDKQLTRHRRFTGFNYISPEEVHDEFNKHYHITDKRYIYLVRFEVEVEGQPDSFEEYLHITSNEKITNMQDLRQEVIDAWADGQKFGRREKYKTKNLLLDTITVLYSVDMKKKV